MIHSAAHTHPSILLIKCLSRSFIYLFIFYMANIFPSISVFFRRTDFEESSSLTPAQVQTASLGLTRVINNPTKQRVPAPWSTHVETTAAGSRSSRPNIYFRSTDRHERTVTNGRRTADTTDSERQLNVYNNVTEDFSRSQTPQHLNSTIYCQL